MTDPSDFEPDRGEPPAGMPIGEQRVLGFVSTASPATVSPATVSPAPVEDLTIEPAPDDLIVLDDLRRVRLFGLDLVDADSLDVIVDQILHGPRRDDDVLPLVLTPNVDILVHLDRHPDEVEAELFRRAQFCLPDGQPLVVVSHLCGRPLRARLPGSGLFARLWPAIVQAATPVVVVAASEEIADLMGREAPHAAFVVPPMFDADDHETVGAVAEEIVDTCRSIQPEFVILGVGSPKDARIIGDVLDRWGDDLGPRPLMMGVGASLAMHLGLTKRAPEWVQRIGMEWFHRFVHEPRRLFHRYFVRDLGFIPIAWREWRSSKR